MLSGSDMLTETFHVSGPRRAEPGMSLNKYTKMNGLKPAKAARLFNTITNFFSQAETQRYGLLQEPGINWLQYSCQIKIDFICFYFNKLNLSSSLETFAICRKLRIRRRDLSQSTRKAGWDWRTWILTYFYFVSS